MKKKAWLFLQCVVLFLIISNAIFQSQEAYHPRSFDPTNDYYMTMGVYDSTNNAYYVDEASGVEGIFTCGPYITLPKGIYDITIYYESTGDGHKCYAESEDSVFFANAMNFDEASLDAVHTSKTFRVKLNKQLEDFEVQTYYSGSGSLLIKGFTIYRGRINLIHAVFMQLCALLLVNLIVYFITIIRSNKVSRQKLITGISLCGIVLLSSLPLLKDGFPRYTTDLNFILMRIEGLKDGLLSGDFPVRIQPNWLNGYGYATSVFYSDIFLYIPALLRMLGVSVQNAYFVYQLTLNILTCVISYHCFRGIFQKSTTALVGSAAYTLSTYRLMLLYYTTRGGMYTAYAFLPLILYGVYLIYYDNHNYNYRSWLYTSLGMTALIHCHLLSAEMVFLSLALLIILSARHFFQKGSVIAMIKAVVVSLGLNIGFLIPMLDYMGDGFYVSSDSWKKYYDYIQKNGTDLSGYLNIFRDTDSYHAPDFLLVCGILLFLLLLLFLPKQESTEKQCKFRTAGIYSAILSIILCFMSTKYFPWDFIEESFEILRMPINSIQYPHRFIEIALLTMTFTLCCSLQIIHNEMSQKWYSATILGLIIVLSINSSWMLSNILNLKTYTSVYDAVYLDTCNISTKEYLPEGSDPKNFSFEAPNAEAGINVTEFTRKGTHLSLICQNNSGKDSLIELPLVFYNGYQATTQDGHSLTLIPSENHTIFVIIPQDYSGEVNVAFHNPFSWTAAMLFSVFFAFAILLLVLKSGIRHHNQEDLPV